MLSKPSLAMILSFFWTTRSTAIPIKISGAISNSLFIAGMWGMQSFAQPKYRYRTEQQKDAPPTRPSGIPLITANKCKCSLAVRRSRMGFP